MTEAVSLGKGAWDCDANREIPPEKEVQAALSAALSSKSRDTIRQAPVSS